MQINEVSLAVLAEGESSREFGQVVITIANFMIVVLACILAVAYTTLIVHTYRGSRNSWLFSITALLILDNAFIAAAIIFAKKMFEPGADVTPIIIVLCTYSNAASNLCSNWSHILIAYKYRHMSRVVPCKLKG